MRQVALHAAGLERDAAARPALMKTVVEDEMPLRLKAAEGKWPDYPQAVVKLAAEHGLTVPGTTLPGSPEQWNKVRKGLRP